jgi:glycosyltransferase involved in cell wall biosynthesis
MLRTATVVSQTKSQARTLSDGFGVDSTVIPNGCVITPESRLSTTASGPDVLWVGRIQHQQKRPDRVLDLAEKTNGIQYEIVGPLEGSDDYCNRFLQRVETMDKVQYSGFVNPDEMVKKYISSDILLNTSDYEGFPNTFLEAWQCRVPVVSQYYSFDDRLQDLDFGFQTGGLTPTADILMNLLADQERLKTIGQRARQFVIDNYSIQNVAADYETLLS